MAWHMYVKREDKNVTVYTVLKIRKSLCIVVTFFCLIGWLEVLIWLLTMAALVAWSANKKSELITLTSSPHF